MTLRKPTVLIVGGTHGNERAGLHLLRVFPPSVSKTLDVHTLIANPKASFLNRRYVDEDMNRCFSLAKLSAKSSATYEAQRAQEIAAIYGAKGSSQVDIAFDLHNSTSNTGILLCMHQNDPLSHEVAAYLVSLDHSIRLCHWVGSGDQPYLPNLFSSGMTVEIGPVTHGLVDYRILANARRVIFQALNYLEYKFSRPAEAPKVKVKVMVGERRGEVDFPRDIHGDLRGFIAPELQHIPELQPGSHLRDGQALFLDQWGNVLECFKAKPGDPLLYPLFVNELAYNEKGVAFFLNELREMNIEILANVPKAPRL